MKRLLALTFILALLVPSGVIAEGVLTPYANPKDRVLYDYRSNLRLQDDFMTGANTTGNVGDLGWTVSGGTSTWTSSTTNRMGLFSRDTSATINTVAATTFNNSTTAMLDPSALHTLLYVHKLNTVDANTAFRSGAGASGLVAVPNDGIYFEKLDADTNWFCITRAASSQTRTDSGIAITTNYITMKTERTAANVQFSLNDVLVCTHTATIPTVFLNPSWILVNSAAASKTVYTDYFELNITGLVR